MQMLYYSIWIKYEIDTFFWMFDSIVCASIKWLQITPCPWTTLSQDVQTRSSVQMAFAKFLSKIKGNF